MTKFIHKIGGMVAGVAFGALAFTSCSEQIDESNLYTFTGETITDYLRSDSTLSDFAQITDYAGLSDRLSAYGTYTCFAPTNEAVKEYIKELWEDKKSANHNGLYTGDVENTLDRLWKSEKRDSLCKDIVEAHLTGLKKTSNDLLAGSDITMMGGNTHSPKRVGDDITIDGTTKIINKDHEVENGVVHTIDKLFYRSTNYIIDEMENMGNYSIWCDALKQTGLDEVLKEHIRTNGINWFTIDPETKYPFAEYPTTCKVGFTVFAETDEVLKNSKYHITNWKELAAKANEWYKDCASWYSYLEDHPEIKISTGTDYTNQWNTLNMFLRYHILKYSLSMDKLVYSYNELEYADVYEYVRTLLPYTMFKLTGVKENGAVSSIWINRVLNNPTLTSTPGANSKDAYRAANTVKDGDYGIQVAGGSALSRQASNGWIHPINDILCYEEKVPNEVLNERMRFEFMSLFDESMTNQIRGYSYQELSSRYGRNDRKIGAIRIPEGFFENMVIYNGESSRVYYLTKDEAKTGNNGFIKDWDCWLDYQGDELFVRGAYDFAIKLPPVPKDGTYELRFGYVITGHRTMVQFSLGHSSDRSKMTTCDIPLDQREGIASTTIGWTDPDKDGDLGAATDKSMHNRGWMRGPNYFSNYKKGAEGTARTNISRQPHIRRVVTKQFFKQGEDNWFRCKTAMPENTEAEFELDYIEIVPASVYNHPTLTEDVF